MAAYEFGHRNSDTFYRIGVFNEKIVNWYRKTATGEVEYYTVPSAVDGLADMYNDLPPVEKRELLRVINNFTIYSVKAVLKSAKLFIMVDYQSKMDNIKYKMLRTKELIDKKYGNITT